MGMRGRHKRIIPTTTAKLGVDTVAMLRETGGQYKTLDQAVWALATRLREFVELRVKDRSPDGSGIPEDVRKKYGVPRDRAVYRNASS